MPFPLDIQFVKRAEAKLGRRLPPDYVIRMCRENGGNVNAAGDAWELYPIFDDSDRRRLKRTCDDVVRETALAQPRPGFPQGAVAIGSNGGGDLLVLLPDMASDGFCNDVFWWDHETGDVDKVAEDFSELDPLRQQFSEESTRVTLGEE